MNINLIKIQNKHNGKGCTLPLCFISIYLLIVTKRDTAKSYNKRKKEMVKIYIDVYFFLNFAIDFLSLFSAEKICFLPESKKRCFIGAFIGGIYSILFFLFDLPFFLHLVTAWVIVTIITYKKGIWKTAYAFFVFIASEIFIGGCVTAIKNLSSLLPQKSLVFAGVIIILAVTGNTFYSLLQLLMKKRLSAISLNANLWHRGRCSKVILMVDSGNLVRERESKKRVIFIKADAIKNSIGDPDTLFEREKCYVIPIDTTSGHGSVMGFVPDKIEFSDKKYNREEFIVVPDIKEGKFGGYDGIAPFI